MSSRPQFNPFPVFTNASMASTVTSKVTIIQKLSQIGYDISWTGTPTGVFSVQVSNTYSENVDGSVRNAGNWTSLVLSTTPSAAGSPGNGFCDIDATGAYAIRLVYAPSGGTGVLNATISAKVS